MGNGSLRVIPTGGLHSGAGPPAKRPLRRRKTRNCGHPGRSLWPCFLGHLLFLQLTRALDQIATLPSTRVLRNEQVRLQVALTTSLMYIRGFASSETRAAASKARLLIEQAGVYWIQR